MKKPEADDLPVVRNRCGVCLPATRLFPNGSDMTGIHRAWCNVGLWPDGPPVRSVAVYGADGGVIK